jgi:uncharacterized protein with FMN-binding domain
MSSNVKPLIALGLTAVGTALVASFHVAEPTTTTAAVISTSSTATTAASATTTTSGTTSTVTTSSTSSSSTYADGTYAGSAVSEPWGTFQVQVTISSGKLTAVTLISSPSDRHSSSINSDAVPKLTQEALAAQSAQVDTVSGATWTSQSYETSLQAALDAAAAAGQKSAS